MSVIREAVVLGVPEGTPPLTPNAPEVLMISRSADAFPTMPTWWVPVDNLPGLAHYKGIYTPEPGGYSLDLAVANTPKQLLVRKKTTERGIDVVYAESAYPASGIQIHTYRACDSLKVSHQEVVIHGRGGRLGPLDGIGASRLGLPLTSWYCPVDEVDDLINYINITLRFENGHTWIDFRGAGDAPYIRLDVFTAREGNGAEGVVGTDQVVLTGGEKVFPIAMPPIPPGKTLLNTWWTPNDNIQALYSFLTIWTEVRDGVVYVHQRAIDDDGGPLRICVYACWG